MNEEDKVRSVVGVLKAPGGPLSPQSQRLLRRLCEAGRYADAVRALAVVLVEQGMANNQIPKNSGIKNRELQILSQTGALRVAKAYEARGGILARYVTAEALASNIVDAWEQGFAAPLPKTKGLLDSLDDEEINSRTSVAVLACQRYLVKEMRKGTLLRPADNDGETGFFIPARQLETVLKQVVARTLRAFDQPNEANHEILHAPEG